MSIKLTYFNIEGAAEKVRLTLAMCEQEFEDERINFQEWGERKKQTPFGQLPVMEVTDATGNVQTFAQSGSMIRWVARRFDKTGKLYPTNVDEALVVDEMLELSNDLARAWTPCLYMGMGYHEKFGHPAEWADKGEVVKQLREKFISADGDLARFMGYFSKQLEKSGGKFFCGDHVTLADLQILPQLRYFTKGVADHVPASCLEAYPTVTAWIARMCAIPQIKLWYKM